MNKWELARYFIDAKKCVDTILYLVENADKVVVIDIREKVKETRSKFYINSCVVLDKSFPRDKRTICQNNIIERIYYERDKNSAHKDENYDPKEYGSLQDIADDMKEQILEVKSLCADYLPNELTVDFVAFDSELYRLAKGITKEKEDEIMNRKFSLRNSLNISQKYCVEKKAFTDTEDIRKISENDKSEYAALFRTGICMEESLQRLQDDFIKANVLMGNTNMWVTVEVEKWIELRKAGILDEYDILVTPKDDEEFKKFDSIIDSIYSGNK